MRDRLRTFFIREDAEYDAFTARYQARSTGAKALYLILHLVPGILAYALINVPAVYDSLLGITGLSAPIFQGSVVLGVFFVWHLAVPLLVLRWADKLSFRESISFLGLRRLDFKGLLVVVPVVFVVYTLCSLPYMKWVFPTLTQWIAAIPGLNPPAYSIWRDPSAAYGLFPAWFVAVGLLGNFFCEEVYFRGYLLKKIGFLGGWSWLVNSVLFALYHIWQAPTTWALIGPVLVFGLLIRWRKNLYPLIAFHFLVNIVWGAIMAQMQ